MEVLVKRMYWSKEALVKRKHRSNGGAVSQTDTLVKRRYWSNKARVKRRHSLNGGTGQTEALVKWWRWSNDSAQPVRA